jgi:hypothetical protein
MKITIEKEEGYEEALKGMSLSYYHELENIEEWWSEERQAKAQKVAVTLAPRDPSHSKFLRQIQLWVLVQAPRFFWSEFDTYKVGVTGLSASTMHTLKKQPLVQANFEYPILEVYLDFMNREIERGKPIDEIKNDLPDGYLQTRMINMNYQVLRNLLFQRATHKLPQWHKLMDAVAGQCRHPELLQGINNGD